MKTAMENILANKEKAIIERRKHWLQTLKDLQGEDPDENILFCDKCGETEAFKEEWEVTHVDGCDKYGNGLGSPEELGSGDTIRFCYNCDAQVSFVKPKNIIDDMIACIDKKWEWCEKDGAYNRGLKEKDRNPEIIKRVMVMRL